MKWLLFALVTVVCFGLYGIFLHKGSMSMADPTHGRFKAFLVVGIAYYIVAIIGSLAILLANGAALSMTGAGFKMSLIAGILGAVGALFILLAFGAKGSPAVVMSIVFAGAPVVNAIVFLSMHPPEGGFGGIPWQFYVGILMAITGGTLVTIFKPTPSPPAKPAVTAQAQP